MNKFKFFAVLVIAVASLSAFKSAGKTSLSGQFSGWWYNSYTSVCEYAPLDGFTGSEPDGCSQTFHGSLCTIDGNPAYSHKIGCDYLVTNSLLRNRY